MSFIESYKHLDKICGEMFETQYGVSAYIEEMLNNPHGSFLVRGWENSTFYSISLKVNTICSENKEKILQTLNRKKPQIRCYKNSKAFTFRV